MLSLLFLLHFFAKTIFRRDVAGDAGCGVVKAEDEVDGEAGGDVNNGDDKDGDGADGVHDHGRNASHIFERFLKGHCTVPSCFAMRLLRRLSLGRNQLIFSLSASLAIPPYSSISQQCHACVCSMPCQTAQPLFLVGVEAF